MNFTATIALKWFQITTGRRISRYYTQAQGRSIERMCIATARIGVEYGAHSPIMKKICDSDRKTITTTCAAIIPFIMHASFSVAVEPGVVQRTLAAVRSNFSAQPWYVADVFAAASAQLDAVATEIDWERIEYGGLINILLDAVGTRGHPIGQPCDHDLQMLFAGGAFYVIHSTKRIATFDELDDEP